MLKSWQFWILTALAVAQAALMATNMVGFGDNRKLQAEVNQRGQFIQESIRLEQLTREIALALAQLGVRNQDAQIQSMLGSLGITINVNEAQPARPAPAAEGKKK